MGTGNLAPLQAANYAGVPPEEWPLSAQNMVEGKIRSAETFHFQEAALY